MARKELTYIGKHGRDKDKAFRLAEMDAMQAEKWAIRLFLALAASGVEVPDNIAQAGLAGVAALTLRALGGLHFELAEPLLDEMLGCVKFIPNPAQPNVVRPLIAGDIDEVRTLLDLRKEVLALHVDFSDADVGSLLATASAQAGQSLSNTSTSRPPSGP